MTTIWIDPDELNTTSSLMVNLAKQIADLAMGLPTVGGPPPENVVAELVQTQKNLATIAQVFVLGADILAQVAAEITGDQSLASAFDSAVGPLAASSLATASAVVAVSGSSPDVVTIGGGASPLLAGLVQDAAPDNVSIGGGVSPALAGLTQDPASDNVSIGGGVSPALAGLTQEPAPDNVTIAGTPTPAFENLGDAATGGLVAGTVPADPSSAAAAINIGEHFNASVVGNGLQDYQPQGVDVGIDGDNENNYTDTSGDTNTSGAVAGYDSGTGDAILGP